MGLQEQIIIKPDGINSTMEEEPIVPGLRENTLQPYSDAEGHRLCFFHSPN
jgi:hypothetical protein